MMSYKMLMEEYDTLYDITCRLLEAVKNPKDTKETRLAIQEAEDYLS